MFEKEAKEYAIDAPPPFSVAREAFHKGAEFGYNKAKVEVEDSYRESLCNSELNLASVTEQLEELEKANEWHYVKVGDLPKHENYVLVSNGKDWTKGFYKDKKWNVISLVGFIRIITWKEIVLPKEFEKC